MLSGSAQDNHKGSYEKEAGHSLRMKQDGGSVLCVCVVVVGRMFMYERDRECLCVSVCVCENM